MTRQLTCIVGMPRSGKTTLAAKLAADSGATVIHSDDYLHLPWRVIPGALLRALSGAKGDVILEGIHVARLLGKPPLRGASVILCHSTPALVRQYRSLSWVLDKVGEYATRHAVRQYDYRKESSHEGIPGSTRQAEAT